MVPFGSAIADGRFGLDFFRIYDYSHAEIHEGFEGKGDFVDTTLYRRIFEDIQSSIDQVPNSVVEVSLIGTSPDGSFDLEGGRFRITVSPRNADGNLVTEGVGPENFAIRDLMVAPEASPGNPVASGVVDSPLGVEIRRPGEGEAVNLTLTFDASRSMRWSDPDHLSIQAGKAIVDQLSNGQHAAVVEFATYVRGCERSWRVRGTMGA